MTDHAGPPIRSPSPGRAGWSRPMLFRTTRTALPTTCCCGCRLLAGPIWPCACSTARAGHVLAASKHLREGASWPTIRASGRPSREHQERFAATGVDEQPAFLHSPVRRCGSRHRVEDKTQPREYFAGACVVEARPYLSGDSVPKLPMPRAMPQQSVRGVLLLARRLWGGGECASQGVHCSRSKGAKDRRVPRADVPEIGTGRHPKAGPDWPVAGMGPFGRTTAAQARSGTVGKCPRYRTWGWRSQRPRHARLARGDIAQRHLGSGRGRLRSVLGVPRTDTVPAFDHLQNHLSASQRSKTRCWQ